MNNEELNKAIEEAARKHWLETSGDQGELDFIAGALHALTDESIYSKARLVKQKDFPLQKLIDIRNALYDRLPKGEVNAWELLDVVKWHINDIDTLCSEIQQLPAQPKQQINLKNKNTIMVRKINAKGGSKLTNIKLSISVKAETIGLTKEESDSKIELVKNQVYDLLREHFNHSDIKVE